MITIDVLRHASTEWNELGRMQGRRDVPLSDAGRAQAAAWRVEPVEGCVDWCTSPLQRATQTARLAFPAPARIEPKLVEMAWGEWEGATLDELRERHAVAFDAEERRGLDFRPPGGESPRDVIERVHGWLLEVEERGIPVIAVTHKGVLRAMLALATGWDMTGKPPVRLAEACVHRFVLGPSGLALGSANRALL
jgi:broad specificity phosphatase PhoE